VARLRISLASLLLLCVSGEAAPSDEGGASDPARFFSPSRQSAQLEIEQALLDLPSRDSLAAVHELVSSEPHVAGSPGDLRVIEKLALAYERLGLEVERHQFWPYLPRPIAAELEIVTPDRVALELREKVVAGDDYIAHESLGFGWNAYSGSGEVTAGVVYVNYGTRADFDELAKLGVDLSGKIALARYGGNFRGYKAKFAEEAGAAGLVIFTDPKDAGYVRGLMYPEGGFANESYIQRGSLKALLYSGDPLTPFEPALEDAERLDPDTVALPRIPVQPIGWGAAQEILSRMEGPVVPEAWQGGLPFNYRLTGGDELRLHLSVEQERRITPTFNVVGKLTGSRFPDEWVIVGSHHDAWSFGAADPNAGTIVVYEVARAFAELARRGIRPERSLLFANWGAEEQGIIGSVEWVEEYRDLLAANGIAYINLDGAAMGPELGASAAPLLKELVLEAAGSTPAAGEAEGSALEAWLARGTNGAAEPRIGNLGGGSDHVGFYCHLGIPSAGVSGRGSRGTSYHSNYENLDWYRQVVGSDYEPAIMLSRVVALMMSRLSNADLLPLSFERYGADLAVHAESLRSRAADESNGSFDELIEKGRTFEERARTLRAGLIDALSKDELSDDSLAQINFELIRLERVWLTPDGVPGRPWFRSLFAATDEDSGYASWMLPALRWAVEHEESVEPPIRAYTRILDELHRRLDVLDSILDPST
jgi:N-acetylated-alpha-linked acidic dipeptidase